MKQEEPNKSGDKNFSTIPQLVILQQEELLQIKNDLTEIKAMIQGGQNNMNPVFGKWIDEDTAQKLLSRKATKLWEWRKEEEIVSTTVGNSVYYDVNSIKEMFERNILNKKN